MKVTKILNLGKIISLFIIIALLEACSSAPLKNVPGEISIQKNKNHDSIIATDSSFLQQNTTKKQNNSTIQSFTKEQLDFLIKEFKGKLKNNAGLQVNVSIDKTVNVWQKGQKGNVPGIEFNPYFNTKFSRDFEKDGNNEIIFTVDETGGGTAVWQTIYSLKEKKDGSFKLIRLNYLCPCQPLRCQASSHPELVNVVNDQLIIKMGCLADDDAECCPGQFYEVTYNYKNDSLIQISKRKI
jgi:hypothetical protein